MNKFCLKTVVWGTIYITIVSGCAVKTFDTKNVTQEMEKSKKEPVLEKNSAREETMEPPIQKSFPGENSSSFSGQQCTFLSTISIFGFKIQSQMPRTI